MTTYKFSEKSSKYAILSVSLTSRKVGHKIEFEVKKEQLQPVYNCLTTPCVPTRNRGTETHSLPLKIKDNHISIVSNDINDIYACLNILANKHLSPDLWQSATQRINQQRDSVKKPKTPFFTSPLSSPGKTRSLNDSHFILPTVPAPKPPIQNKYGEDPQGEYSFVGDEHDDESSPLLY